MIAKLPKDSNSENVTSIDTSFLKNYLQHFTRQSRRSIWLLVYIALVSSWPFAGPALSFLFKKKIKKILPTKPLK